MIGQERLTIHLKGIKTCIGEAPEYEQQDSTEND